MASSEPAILREFFVGKTDFPVIIPEMKDCTLLGGILDEYPKGVFAHVLYDHQAEPIYLYQTSWNKVLSGEGVTVDDEIRNTLLESGWCSRISPEGHTVVLWNKGTTLCSAVSDLSIEDLITCLTSGDPDIIPR
jgi:hypothetical protein